MRGSCLNSNDVFILKKEKAYFIWCGKGSTGDEREMAKLIAKRISKDDYNVIFEGEIHKILYTKTQNELAWGQAIVQISTPDHLLTSIDISSVLKKAKRNFKFIIITYASKFSFAGQEKDEFWKTIGGKQDYASNKKLATLHDPMPARLFQISNATGRFRGKTNNLMSIQIGIPIGIIPIPILPSPEQCTSCVRQFWCLCSYILVQDAKIYIC